MIRLKVNGDQRTFDGDPEMPLLWYLRDEAGLKGTKFGCGIAECGACTVHVDGQAVREWARWAFRHWPRRCATLYSRRPERVSARCP